MKIFPGDAGRVKKYPMTFLLCGRKNSIRGGIVEEYGKSSVRMNPIARLFGGNSLYGVNCCRR